MKRSSVLFYLLYNLLITLATAMTTFTGSSLALVSTNFQSNMAMSVSSVHFDLKNLTGYGR